jgi:hypothetical protein
MARALITVIWISLIVGTCVAGNVVGNWLVCLLGLYLLIRYRQGRASRVALNGQPSTASRPYSIGAAPTPASECTR